MLTAFLTAFYMGRVVFVAFFGAQSDAATHAHEPGWSMKGPLVLLATLSVVAGYFGGDLAHLGGHEYHFHFSGGAALASGLGLVGIALAYMVYGRGPRATPAVIESIDRIAQSRAVNRVYEFGFHRVTLGGAAVLAWIDRYVIDGLINITGYATLDLGGRARKIQTGQAADYVLAVVLGVVAMAAWVVVQ